jgi:hypothetical protein
MSIQSIDSCSKLVVKLSVSLTRLRRAKTCCARSAEAMDNLEKTIILRGIATRAGKVKEVSSCHKEPIHHVLVYTKPTSQDGTKHEEYGTISKVVPEEEGFRYLIVRDNDDIGMAVGHGKYMSEWFLVSGNTSCGFAVKRGMSNHDSCRQTVTGQNDQPQVSDHVPLEMCILPTKLWHSCPRYQCNLVACQGPFRSMR